jgi:chorismate--pyruvate lyase
MTSCKSDDFWHHSTAGCSADLRPWLQDRGSLTLRIQQRCTHFAVHPLRSGLARIAYDESAVLGIAAHRSAWSREVFLQADGRPVVFAHSACREQDLRGVWQAMRGLGNRSLGTLLFTHPLVERHPLHYAALRPHHPLYQSAVAATDTRPERLWARRSLFSLHGAPLLVTEVFLPAILDI